MRTTSMRTQRKRKALMGGRFAGQRQDVTGGELLFAGGNVVADDIGVFAEGSYFKYCW